MPILSLSHNLKLERWTLLAFWLGFHELSLAEHRLLHEACNDGLTWLAQQHIIKKEGFLWFYHEILKNNGW